MSTDRREFFGKLLSSGAMGAFLAPALLEAELATAGMPPVPQEEAPHDSLSFWSGFFDSVNPNVPASEKRGDPEANMPDPNRKVQYLHYTETTGLRFVEDVKTTELLPDEGDVVASMSLGAYRPASGDTIPVQLRLDCVQTSKLLAILDPLAWSAMVALQPTKAGQMPSLDDIGFKPNMSATQTQTSQILLTKGTGKVSFNVTRNSTKMQTLFGTVLKYAKIAAPVLSFPAISVPAIQTFSEVYSYWEERTRFIMNSPLQLAVASQAAVAADPEASSAPIKLIPGTYVLVPTEHADAVNSQLSNLTMQDSYLVAKNATTLTPEERKKAALPGVTYVTIHAKVSSYDTAKDRSTSSEKGAGAAAGGKSKGATSKEGSAKGAEAEKPCTPEKLESKPSH